MDLIFPHNKEWELSNSTKLKTDSRSIEFPSNLWKRIFQYLNIHLLSQKTLPVCRTFFRDTLQVIEEEARKQRDGKDVEIIFEIDDCTIPYPFLWGVCFQDFVDKREMHCVALLHFYKICPSVKNDFKDIIYGFDFKSLVESKRKYDQFTIFPNVPSPWNLDESIVRSILKKEGKEDMEYARAIASWSCYHGKNKLVKEALEILDFADITVQRYESPWSSHSGSQLGSNTLFGRGRRMDKVEFESGLIQLLFGLACSGGKESTIKEIVAFDEENHHVSMFWGDQEILVVAGIRGNIELFDFIVDEAAGALDPDDYGETFEQACECNNLHLVKHLVEHHSIEPCGLLEASREGNYEIVKYLLDDGRVDPNADSSESIRRALEKKHHHIVDLLLSDPRVHPDQKLQAEFQLAVEDRKFDIAFEMMKNPKIDPSRDDNWCIKNLCNEGRGITTKYLDFVRELLNDERVDPSTTNNFCIMWSAYSGIHGVVGLLLEHEMVDPSVDDNDPIRWSARNGHFKVVDLLLKHPKVDPTARNYEALSHPVELFKNRLEKMRRGDKEVDVQEESLNKYFQTIKLLIKDGRVDKPAMWNVNYDEEKVVKFARAQLKYEVDERILGLIKEDEEERMKFLSEKMEKFLEKNLKFRISLREDNTVKWGVQISKLFFVLEK